MFPTDHEEIIIGSSQQMRDLFAAAEKVAKSPMAAILVVGESGSGKEVIARYIHRIAPGPSQPFIDVHCGAIPESLLESELFGFEKGAFADATFSKPGLFELANGGTIFLDEIAETSPSLQAKLLKVVERRRVRRLGGVNEFEVKSRIIAATSSDLDRAVAEGSFREDLYDRLNVFRLEVPPLRARREDILPLANHFLGRFTKEYQKSADRFSEAARRKLLEYPWPGNVRQLRNAIERAVVVNEGRSIKPEHLELPTPVDRRRNSRVTLVTPEALEREDVYLEIPPQGLPLEKVEEIVIRSALRCARGNLSEASRLLHMRRGKLRYRVEKLGLNRRFLHSLRNSG
jgi:DNA-binding NtrC family response regulator